MAQQPAGKSEVLHKISLEAHHLVLIFIDQNHASQLLGHALSNVFWFVLGVALEIKDQNVLAAEAFVAGIYELASAEKHFNPGFVVVLFALSFLSCFLLFFFLFALLFLNFLDAFFRDVVLLSLFFFTQRLAIFTYQRGDLFAVQIEKRVFLPFHFRDFPGTVIFGFFGGAPASIIFFYFVRRFLVDVNFRKQLLEVGETDLRFDWKIEDPFATALIYRNLIDDNVVDLVSAVQFEFVGNTNGIFRTIVVVENLLRRAACCA